MNIKGSGIQGGEDSKRTGITVKITNNVKKDFKKQIRQKNKENPFTDIIWEECERISNELDKIQKQASRVIYEEMAETIKAKTPVDNSPTRTAEKVSSKKDERPQEHLKDKIQRRIKQTSTYVTTIFAGWETETFKKIADYNQYGTPPHQIDGPLHYPDRENGGDWIYIPDGDGVFHPGSMKNAGFLDEAKIDIESQVLHILNSYMNNL